MALSDRKSQSASELQDRYARAVKEFASNPDWRTCIRLADEFRDMGSFKDAQNLYVRCIKAASAPAYREITDALRHNHQATAEDYLEAARIMQLIQDYSDARQNCQTYRVKAHILIYNEAQALLSRTDRTDDDRDRAVELLRTIRDFKDVKDILEIHETPYFEHVYGEATALTAQAKTADEWEKAAGLFDRIPEYLQSAENAAQCRKKATRLRVKEQKQAKLSPGAEEKSADTSGEEKTTVRTPSFQAGQHSEELNRTTGKEEGDTVRVPKRKKTADETSNRMAEIWKEIHKKYLIRFIMWIVLLILDMVLSVRLPAIDNKWVQAYADYFRLLIVLIAIGCIIMMVRDFSKMLPPRARKKLGETVLHALKKFFKPLSDAFVKLLAGIGIDLSRRNRLSGRDEKSFLFHEGEPETKRKKRLKNEQKWVDQPDNAARVRFLFIDYMIRHIRDGYFMRHTQTPAEIGQELAESEEEQELFRVYQMARYAGKEANGEISDETVGKLQLVNRRKY